MKRQLERLIAKANRRISTLGGEVSPGHFVCSTCLRLLPVASATEGHFPARSAPAERRRTELQCGDCNSRIGGTYEIAGVDFLLRRRTFTMTRPGIPQPYLKRQGHLRPSDEAVSIELDSPSRRRGRRDERHANHAHTQFDRIFSGAPEPREIEVTVEKQTDDAVKRALIAWSYLTFFHYAGYRYAASAGAELVRRLILDPSAPLPDGIAYTKGELAVPLADPRPVLIVRVEDGDIVEVISQGVAWDRGVIVLPCANDRTDRAWRRISQLLVINELTTVEVRSLRHVHESLLVELDAHLSSRSDDGVEREVTADLTPLQVQALAAGVFPRKIDPRKGGPWKAPMQVEYQFKVAEGDGPPPGRRRSGSRPAIRRTPRRTVAAGDLATRSAYWTERFGRLGGGLMQKQVGLLLVEIPGLPQPIPARPPISMERAPEGWIATLHFKPVDTRAFGVDPARAVGALLAKVEQEFAATSA